MDTSMLSKSIWQDGPGGASAGYFGRKAAQAEEEIQKLEAQDHGKVVLDAEKLEYISSAGLRVILRLRKQEPELAIVNASPEVYEIFEMTGFTEMMPVSRAYRRVSVDGCEVIGQGANGKVYRLDPETIIKVYLNPNSLPDIHRERELARKAFVLGIPTAIPYDVVKVGDGYGSVFELLNAKSFGSLIAEHPEEMDKYVKMYVDLLKKIHGTEVHPEDLRDMKSSWASARAWPCWECWTGSGCGAPNRRKQGPCEGALFRLKLFLRRRGCQIFRCRVGRLKSWEFMFTQRSTCSSSSAQVTDTWSKNAISGKRHSIIRVFSPLQ